jgi:hypothetical protein
MKKIDKKSDKNLVKRSAYELADSIVSNIPILAQAWALSNALYGNALELRQQRALEWVEAISKDSSTFSKDLVNSEEFQDGFVVALEDYIKLRNQIKRRVALKMFKEFALSDNKMEFQLERFNDTLLKISTMSIQTLAFIKEAILPLREQAIRDDLAKKKLGAEKPYEWWYERALKMEPVSKYFDKWIYDGYNPNSESIKNKHNKGNSSSNMKLLGELFDAEREVRERMTAPLSELEYLGLVRWNVQPEVGWSSAGTSAWKLTDFAYQFIAFIEEAPEGIWENQYRKGLKISV